jgi:hypothetical protein
MIVAIGLIYFFLTSRNTSVVSRLIKHDAKENNTSLKMSKANIQILLVLPFLFYNYSYTFQHQLSAHGSSFTLLMFSFILESFEIL